MTAPFFPHDYDPTAAAALEMMRRLGTPSPAPAPGSAVPRQPSDMAMPPGWRGGPHAVSPLAALSQQAHELLNPMTYAEALKGLVRPFQPIGRTAGGSVVPFPGQKEMAEQVQELNRTGHPLLGLAAMGMGVGIPESEAIGPEVSNLTRPILSDIENAAAGAKGVKMPQAAIVSASLGELSAAKNAARHKGMLADLKANGVPHVEVSGRWLNPESGKWESEKSVLIPGMERAQAVHYGDRWGQHSVLTIGGDEPGMHNVGTGETQPFSNVHEAVGKEAHTVLPSGKKISFEFQGSPRQTGTPTPQPITRSEPTNPIASLADEYRASRGLTHDPLPKVTKVDPSLHQTIAQHYERTPSMHNDPATQQSYAALMRTVNDQADFLKSKGYTMDVVKNPTIQSIYETPEAMHNDVLKNKHLSVNASTVDQANLPPGQSTVVPGQMHPLLTNEENDRFRWVHDILGHTPTRSGFDLAGEEQAFRNHAATMPPEALPALAAETRGQTATYFHGSRPGTFVEQKAMMLPPELTGGYAGERSGTRLPPGAPDVLGASDPKYAYKSPPTYHGTTHEGFDVPTLSSDIGPHTGTREQAAHRASENNAYDSPGQRGTERVLRLYSGVKSPLRLGQDLGMWSPPDLARTIANHPDIHNTPAFQTFRKIADEPSQRTMDIGKSGENDMKKAWLGEIKDALKAHGYDAIEYPNEFEGTRGPGGHSGFSTIHLDPEKSLSTKPSIRGFAIPQEDVPGLSMGVAHLGAGAKSPQAFAEAVSREHPQLGAQMKASPWLASKMYSTAKKYRGMIEKMPTPEQAIATARSPEGQGIQKWYNGLDGVLKDAGLSDRERDVFHRIGAISSMQKSPKDELARALDAFATWKRSGPSADFSKMRNYTAAQRKMLSGIAADAPWTKVTQGPKVSGYVLARQNQPEGVALDRHINEYYTGKQHLNDTERQIVEGRLRSDASKAGMTAREFQAALWGGKTKYAPGYGEAGATLENWLRFHLSSGKYEDLLEQVPGFQKLAEEGAHMSEHLPPTEPTNGEKTPF